MENVIVSGSFGVFEDRGNRGKEFSCKAKASRMQREYPSFCV